MEKTLEMRVEELERMLFMTKNVLSFDLQADFGQPDSPLQAAGEDALLREVRTGGMATPEPGKDQGADRTGSAEICP